MPAFHDRGVFWCWRDAYRSELERIKETAPNLAVLRERIPGVLNLLLLRRASTSNISLPDPAEMSVCLQWTTKPR